MICLINNISIIMTSPLFILRSSSLPLSLSLFLFYLIPCFLLYLLSPFYSFYFPNSNPNRLKLLLLLLISNLMRLFSCLSLLIFSEYPLIIFLLLLIVLNQPCLYLFEYCWKQTVDSKPVLIYFQYLLLINQVLMFIDWFNVASYPILIIFNNLVLLIVHFKLSLDISSNLNNKNGDSNMNMNMNMNRLDTNQSQVVVSNPKKTLFINSAIFSLLALISLLLIILKTRSFSSIDNIHYKALSNQ